MRDQLRNAPIVYQAPRPAAGFVRALIRLWAALSLWRAVKRAPRE